MPNPRDHLGLPDVNGGRFVIHGELVDGKRGGAIEYLSRTPPARSA